MERRLGRKEILIFLLALLVSVGGWTYPKLDRYRKLTSVEQSLMADDFASADQVLAHYLRAVPNDRHAWMLSAVIARRTEKESEFEQSLVTASQLGVPPNEIEFQRKLFKAQHGAIEKQSELALLRSAEEFKSDFVAAQTYEAIARGYLSSYRMNEAWGCVDHWLHWRPDSLSAHFIRAEIILRTQGSAGVIEPYRDILKIDPNSKAAQEKLAVNLLAVNEVDEAATILRNLSTLIESEMTMSQQWSLVPVRSSKPQVWIELAEAERRLGNIDATHAAVARAASMGLDDNQRARVSAIRGQIQLIEQKPEEAVASFLVTIELTPSDVAAHHALGNAFGFLGKTELATKHREAAQQIRASIGEVTQLSQKVISSPNNPELRMRIGQEFIKQGLNSEGIGWIKTALDCDANFEPARRFLNSLPTAQPKPTGSERIRREGDE